MNQWCVAGLVVCTTLSSGCVADFGHKPQPRSYRIEDFVGTERNFGVSFSPDETEVLYSSDRSGGFEAYLASVEGMRVDRLTQTESGSVWGLSFFPRDRRMLFMRFRQQETGADAQSLSVRQENGEFIDLKSEPGVRVEFRGWSRDGRHFYYLCNERREIRYDLYQVDSQTLERRLFFKNDEGYVMGPVSDDRRFVALSEVQSAADGDMLVHDRQTGKTRRITKSAGAVYFRPLAFQPGHDRLFYLTDLDHEYKYLRLFDLETDSDEVVERAEWDILDVVCSKSGRYRVMTLNQEGLTRLRVKDLQSNRDLDLPTLPDGQIENLVISDSEEKLAFYVNGPTQPDDLYVWNLAADGAVRLTESLPPQVDRSDLVQPRSVHFESFDQTRIHALLYQPRLEQGKRAPALVWAHGGFGGQARFRFFPLIQYLVHRGFAVLAVNYRGSSGYGKTFARLGRGRRGRDDLEDCVRGRQFLSGLDWVDEGRIGIIGGSYGGFLALSASVHRPEEFVVSIDLFGINDWVQTLKSIPPWRESIRRALYAEIGHPEKDVESLRAMSPRFSAGRIRRPLMVVQGAGDPWIDRHATDAMVADVKAAGTAVDYLVLPDEGHMVERKENRIRLYKSILKFLEVHLR